ncbi:DEAD/DEAH box helicase family protein [Thermoleophilum album]|uniref:Type III restriction enzyme n=1 Tax=Thermoleophilum album TaxID=29539 RepID=A0A1H6FSK2_THEAL|nr:DEAD/DEAH box helicase family protein [Thermoleophilum album]SEH13891.1 type III restriction enzyme [Thermoleophilum album]
MAKAVIAYDKDLPEIPGRRPWEKPTQHLIKDPGAPTGWSVAEGRRPSRLLLVPKIREAVDAWRDGGYPGASEVTRRLFEYWFEEDHEVPGFNVPFRYYFCQREAIETLAWLVEVANARDAQELIRSYATTFKKDLLSDNITFQTTMDGRRQLRRYVPERNAEGVQDLPPENLRRYAFKLATGSGKTWVMAMAVVWSYFHRQRVSGSDLSTNFLIVAPNVIVYQRLEKDFAANRIFYELPLIPPEWRGAFSLKVILRGKATEPDPSGNLFLTNIQQLYESREQEWTPANAIEALLGKKPVKDLAASGRRSMLERVKSLRDLVVINDEAHHVHDQDLAWSQSLLAVHQALPNGLALWLDFSATPKDQNGMYFPWTVCDYPLAQAVEDRIVKAPLIVTKEDDPNQPKDDPEGVTKDNIGEKYGYWLRAAVARWKEHHEVYRKLGTRPVLFIMAEKNAYADAIGAYLWKTKEFGFKESEVLVIHTDAAGEITKKDLDKAREAARDIDKAKSKLKAIVSVMMLREGWDVRNVTVVLGLRPFTAKAEILPEQVIGRGLRLMTQVSPDRTQTLEVLGTRNLLKVLKEQLEAEGVGVGSTRSDPPPPVIIAPVQERLQYDIAIPLTKPSLAYDIRKLSDLDVDTLDPIFDQTELDEPFRVKLRLEFATTETEVHQADIAAGDRPPSEVLSSITKKVIDRAKLPSRFAELYPAVRDYVAKRCFGKTVNVEDDALRSHLARPELQEGIAKYLARKIAELTIERRAIEFDRADFRLSETKPFSWRRNLPPLEAEKTVFNYVATYNDFERRFAEFLDQATDVVRFASLGTTQQGESGTQFRVDYLKPSGAIGFYHPDWVVVQRTPAGEVNWIIETKGRVWEGTAAKDEALKTWCERVTAATDRPWRYARIDQTDFDKKRGAQTLDDLVR